MPFRRAARPAVAPYLLEQRHAPPFHSSTVPFPGKETGGLRWGESFWMAANATWPFATLNASPEALCISGIVNLDFRKADIKAIRRKKGMLPFSTGIVIEHQKLGFPEFILFWTFRYKRLKTELTRLGFIVTDK